MFDTFHPTFLTACLHAHRNADFPELPVENIDRLFVGQVLFYFTRTNDNEERRLALGLLLQSVKLTHQASLFPVYTPSAGDRLRVVDATTIINIAAMINTSPDMDSKKYICWRKLSGQKIRRVNL